MPAAILTEITAADQPLSPQPRPPCYNRGRTPVVPVRSLREKVEVMEAYAYVLITIAAVVVLELLILLILGGGSLARLGTAWQAFRRVLGDPAVAAKVQPLLGPAAAAEQKPAKRSAEPLRL